MASNRNVSSEVSANGYGIFTRMNKSTAGGSATLRRWAPLVGLMVAAWAVSAWAAEMPPLDIRVVSGKEVVFDWKRDRCDDQDIPDTALTAYRRAGGQIVGLATHWRNRLFLVAEDHSFKRDCRIVYEGNRDPDPAAFDDKTWIAAPWTADGRTVYALGHNEYQGHSHSGKCKSNSYSDCWYNSVVLLRSTDGGALFSRISNMKPVANAAFTYEALQGAPRGFFEPTNVIKNGDYHYTIIFTTGGNGQERGNCLFRARSFGNDKEWEYWTTDGFYPSRSNPYENASGKRPSCKPLKGLGGRVWSIRRHRPSGLYLATTGSHAHSTSVGTIGISISRDMYEWSPAIPLFSVPLLWSRSCSHDFRYSYASLIDLDSSDRNFSDLGEHAELYLTEIKMNGCRTTLDRKLIRYHIALSARALDR